MALNEKNPPVTPNPNLVGLDGAIEILANKMGTEIPWLPKSWGRAKQLSTKIIKDAVNEPMVYLSNKEYYAVMPNDNFQAYSFWQVNGPSKALDKGFETMVSCIVWCNLQKIDRAKDYLFTQELITDVLNVFYNYGDFEVLSIYDEKVEEIFKGMTLKPEHRDLLMYPYQAFRIEGKLNHDINYC